MHERILYEELLKNFHDKREENKFYNLLNPLTFTFSINEIQVLEEFKGELNQAGFYLEHFQGSEYLLRKIPIIFKGRKIEKIIKDMLDDLSVNSILKSVDTKTQRMLTFLACRGAVKAGDILSLSEMENLIKQFMKTKNNATCPHGRPTTITIDQESLQRAFRRAS